MLAITRVSRSGLPKSCSRSVCKSVPCGQRWASTERDASQEDPAAPTTPASGEPTKEAASMAGAPQASSGKDKRERAALRPPSSENLSASQIPRGRLSEILRRQRLALQGGEKYTDEDLARELEALSGVKVSTGRRDNFSSSSSKGPSSSTARSPTAKPKVDLYLNEQGFAQTRVTQTIARPSNRQRPARQHRDQLAPRSGPMNERSVSDPRDDAASSMSRIQPSDRRYARGERPALRPSRPPRAVLPDSTDFASRFGALDSSPQGRPRYGGQQERNRAGPRRTGPGGGGGMQRFGGPQRPARRQRQSNVPQTSAPVKKLSPPPKTVLDAAGHYSAATMKSVTTGGGKVFSATLAAQVNKKDLVNLGNPKAASRVVRGDWEAYVAPIFRGGKLPLLGDGPASMSDRARIAIANNPSITLGQKVELANKIASHL